MDPQQVMQAFQQAKNMYKNANGDSAKVEEVCRNLCATNGLDYNAMWNAFQKWSGGRFNNMR